MALFPLPTRQLPPTQIPSVCLPSPSDPRPAPHFVSPPAYCASYALLGAFLCPAIRPADCPKHDQLTGSFPVSCFCAFTLVPSPSPPPTCCGDPELGAFDTRDPAKYNPWCAHRRTLGSRESEITGLAELQGLTVCRCGNRIRTHNPEVIHRFESCSLSWPKSSSERIPAVLDVWPFKAASS